MQGKLKDKKVNSSLISLFNYSQTNRAYRPGESCEPLSAGSWCLWGEIELPTQTELISQQRLMIDFIFTYLTPCSLSVEWGPPASGSWTAGKSLQTSGQIKKVKEKLHWS